jgi:hypothetical protein
VRSTIPTTRITTPQTQPLERTSPTETPRTSTTTREPGGNLTGIPVSRTTQREGGGAPPPVRQDTTAAMSRLRHRPFSSQTPMSPADTRALLQASPLATPEITPVHPASTTATGEASSSTAVSLPHQAALARLEAEFKAAKERPVLAGEAAALINELRKHGPRAHAEPGITPAATNGDLMEGVTEAHVQRWFRAQGLDDGQAAAMRAAAFKSGLANPTGSFATNVLQFIGSPWVSAKHTPLAGALMGGGTALLAPALNSAQQSAVVTFGESVREHGGPVIVPDKKNINDKHYLPELATELEQRVKDFSALHEKMTAFAEEHELDLGALQAELAQAREQGEGAELPPALASLTPEQRTALQQHGKRLLAAEEKLHSVQRDFLMTQGAHDRQWKGNANQAAPRIMRSPAAALLGLLAKTGSKVASPIAQTVVAMLMTTGQHLAAGFDERNKQDYNNQLNLMYGDCLKPTGHEKLARGEPVTSEDIDEAKLRGFAELPAQSYAKQVSKQVESHLAALRTALEGQDEASLSPEDARALAGDRAKLAELENDVKHLKSGDLTQLTPGGLGERLLVGTDGKVVSQALWNQIAAKYTAREFTAQTAQRIGQAFHMVVAGSAVPSVVGKVVSTVFGGGKKTPVPVTLGVAALSGALSTVGAMTTHTAITVKNNRRESDPDIGFWKQVGRGMLGGPRERNGNKTATEASKEMNAKFAEESINATLQFAHDLRAVLGDVDVAETITPEQASERLKQPAKAGIDEVHIQMTSMEQGESSQSGAG